MQTTKNTNKQTNTKFALCVTPRDAKRTRVRVVGVLAGAARDGAHRVTCSCRWSPGENVGLKTPTQHGEKCVRVRARASAPC